MGQSSTRLLTANINSKREMGFVQASTFDINQQNRRIAETWSQQSLLQDISRNNSLQSSTFNRQNHSFVDFWSQQSILQDNNNNNNNSSPNRNFPQFGSGQR